MRGKTLLAGDRVPGLSHFSQPCQPLIFCFVDVMDSYEIFSFLTKLLNGGSLQ